MSDPESDPRIELIRIVIYLVAFVLAMLYAIFGNRLGF